jgi:hypothetical protein
MSFVTLGALLAMLATITDAASAHGDQKAAASVWRHTLRNDGDALEYYVLNEPWVPPITPNDSNRDEDEDEDEDEGEDDGDADQSKVVRTFLTLLKIGMPSNPVKEVIIRCNKPAISNTIAIGLSSALLTDEVNPKAAKAFTHLDITLPPHANEHVLEFNISGEGKAKVTLDKSEFAFIYEYRENTEEYFPYISKYTPTTEDMEMNNLTTFAYGEEDRSKELDATSNVHDILFLCIRESTPNQIASIEYVPTYTMGTLPLHKVANAPTDTPGEVEDE